jgi:hypothetical protein
MDIQKTKFTVEDFVLGVVANIHIHKEDIFELASDLIRKACDLFCGGPIMWIGIVVRVVCMWGVGEGREGGEAR